MKLHAYDDCKPSGVEWLGDVPKHWDIKPMRRLGDAIIGLTYSPENVVQENEGVLVLRSSNLQGGRITRDDNVFVNAAVPDELRTKTGDILICSRNGSRDLVGKCARVFPSNAGLTFGAFTTVFRSDHSDFLFYVLNSSLFSFQAGLYQTSTIYQLTTGTLNAMMVPIPPKTEQRAIADFLDRETARLDTLVDKKRELIEKLKEKRTALISRTVTRGLNPTAKLKPSGIEWLGDIPEHWDAKRLKHGAIVTTGFAFSSDDFTSDGVPVLRIGDIDQEGRVVWCDAKFLPVEYLRRHSSVVVRKGDIVMAMTGATIGKVGRYVGDAPALLNQRVCIFRALESGEQTFLWYLLNSEFYIEHVVLTAFGGAQPNISDSDLLTCPVPLPEKAEQRAIARYLDCETAKIDKMIEKVEAAIEKLQEYRTALIAAAVTGKIDVRNGPKSAVST